ncbi:MAG: hypothetical protein JHC95_07290 [Solirubrobacteraceae bacterium]|nr:hypothetical protein [Solirubrobacteraceae bacterium]
MQCLSRCSLPLVLACLSLVVCPAAHGGVYRVYSCKTPAGAVAPTDGWSAFSVAPLTTPVNGCSGGGPLTLALNASTHNPAGHSLMTWRWDAPAGTSIASYRVWRTVTLTAVSEPNATPVAFVARPVNVLSGAYVPDGCRAAPDGCFGLGGSPGILPGNLLQEDLGAVGQVDRWHINVDCGGVDGYWCVPRPTGQPMAVASVYAAEFSLRDADAPKVSNQTGRVLGASGVHSGLEQLSFTATDAASGMYRALLEVDGKVSKTTSLGANDGRCVDAGVDASTPYEFLYREPCEKSVQHDFVIDTRTIPDGTHSVKVLVEDASGNRTSAWSTPDFVVRNAGEPSTGFGATGSGSGGGGATAMPCAGTSNGLTARFTRNASRTITVKYGQALTVGGRGPAGAGIDVFHVRGSKVTPLGATAAAANGTFTDRIPTRYGNGTIRLCGPGLVADLNLKVKAAVSLKVRISRNGLVRYSGRVPTGQIPKGGKIITVQGKAGPSWQTFALRRTDKKGRFKGRYRLRVVVRGARLKFRVRVPSEAGYPFVGVVGKAQTKRVR